MNNERKRIDYQKDFERIRDKVEEYRRLMSRAKCLEGEDCDTCIYLEMKRVTDFKTCALNHKNHVSEEDIEKIKEYYKDRYGE